LLAFDLRMEIIRLNSQFWDNFSDYDPLLASFLVRAVPEAPPLSLFVFAILAMAAVRRQRRMVRLDCRRIHIQLKRDGWHVDRNIVYRLDYEEGLCLWTKRPKRRKMAVHREARIIPTKLNQP
jgi:hypothetical protein